MRRGSGVRRFLRRLLKTFAVLAIVGATVYAVGEWYKGRDYLPHFIERKGELVRADENLIVEEPGFRLFDITFEDSNGVEVIAHLKVPRRGGSSHPVMITLGGTDAGRETIEYLGDTTNWMILALDYPYRGPTDDLSHWQFVSIVPQARRALMDTVPAGMMVLDYLHGRGDVDTDRIVVAGGSFGALISPALAAADERITAVAILFGAGDLQQVIEANLPLPEIVRPPVAWLGSVIVSPFEPLKYIGKISPRPVFFLSGTEDVAMPEAISRALHEAAGEPKKVTWLPLGHVNLDAKEFHQQVLDACMEWLIEIDFMTRDEVFILPD
jgi:hypothetical protein